MKQWIDADYEGLKKAMLKHYAKDDIEQRMYTTTFLDTYRSTPRTEKDDIPDYFRNFNLIAQHCMKKQRLSKHTVAVWFLHGLPLSLAKKTIRKFAIDIKDPSTVDYEKILQYIEHQIESDQSIEDLELARGTQGRTELIDLVGQLRPIVSVAKDQRFAELVVKSNKAASSLEFTAVNQLTKAFEKFSVNPLQQV